MIFQTLIDSNISYEDYTTVISEEERYRRMKEDIRMTKNQRSNAEKDELNEESKKKHRIFYMYKNVCHCYKK